MITLKTPYGTVKVQDEKTENLTNPEEFNRSLGLTGDGVTCPTCGQRLLRLGHLHAIEIFCRNCNFRLYKPIKFESIFETKEIDVKRNKQRNLRTGLLRVRSLWRSFRDRCYLLITGR